MPPTTKNGWERWRGTVDEKLHTIATDIAEIKQNVSTLPNLKARVAVISGIFGIIAGIVADAVVQKLF